nr:hypothetical protein [Tanacetum cinerariifolium]
MGLQEISKVDLEFCDVGISLSCILCCDYQFSVTFVFLPESGCDRLLFKAKTDEEEVALDAESQERTNLKTKVHLVKENVNVASKGVNVVIDLELVSTVEPTMFDDEDVTLTMAQTLIKLKAEKARILDEKIAQKLHDEEVRKGAARDEQERVDNKKALELQRQLDEKEDDIDWSTVAEQKDKDVQKTKKKRVADETLLQESFKKLRAAEVSGSESTQEIPTDDPKEITEEDVQNMLEIVPLQEFRVEALQVKYPIIDWEIHTEDQGTEVFEYIVLVNKMLKLKKLDDWLDQGTEVFEYIVLVNKMLKLKKLDDWLVLYSSCFCKQLEQSAYYKIFEDFRLKMLGFTNWLELHKLASWKQGAANDQLLKNLKAKFKWVASTIDKLNIPPPHHH